jgi:hypothetical protein
MNPRPAAGLNPTLTLVKRAVALPSMSHCLYFYDFSFCQRVEEMSVFEDLNSKGLPEGSGNRPARSFNILNLIINCLKQNNSIQFKLS